MVVASVPMPPSRSKKARIGATRLRRVAIHPADQRANGSAPDVFALDHPGAGSLRLRHRRADPWVLFAGSRRGQVEPPVCRALVERFRRHGFGFFVGCATGVDAAFRAALAHSACGPDEVFVGCAFGNRARRCRAEGRFASAVVPEGIPPRAALARRTLWLVKRSSLVVLFPERPADRQWGPARGTCFDRVSTILSRCS